MVTPAAQSPTNQARRFHHGPGTLLSPPPFAPRLSVMKNGSFLARLGYALNGVRIAFRREKSFRTQCVLALLAIGVAILTRPSLIWWAVLALCIAIVFAAELFNAAIEYLIDRLHPEIHEEIKFAKDAAASAVLLASLGTGCVGMLMIVDWYLRTQ